MKKVGVIFGGVTCEHDVSIVTGLQLIENMKRVSMKLYRFIFIQMVNGILAKNFWILLCIKILKRRKVL